MKITSNNIIPSGTRVWIYEPMIDPDQKILGITTGWSLTFEAGEEFLQYEVDIGIDERIWVADFQITSWMRLIRGGKNG